MRGGGRRGGRGFGAVGRGRGRRGEFGDRAAEEVFGFSNGHVSGFLGREREGFGLSG